jgi:hypothetical protein
VIKNTFLTLTFCTTLCAATPKLTFTKSFPGSDPEYVRVDVDRSGALEYRESQKDDQPLRAQLQEPDTATLFSMAEKLDYFKSPLEAGVKVANMGKKTFRYEDENGAATEVTFNFSTNETAQQLLQRFEQIAATERAYIDLDRTIHFDKLGVNAALAEIESLWLRKELVAPQQFVPLLKRISSHDSFMHLARERAARLKDQFEAAPAGAAVQTQK